MSNLQNQFTLGMKEPGDNSRFFKNPYFYLLVFFVAFILVEFISVTHSITWLQTVYLIVFFIMLLGQIFLITPFGHLITYYCYFVSIIVGVNFALYIWFARNTLFSYSILAIDVAVWSVCTTAFAVLHYSTFRKTGSHSLTNAFSFFLFGLIFIFSAPKVYSSTAYNVLFFLSIALFMGNGALCANQMLRAAILTKELGIADRINYVSQVKVKLQRISDVSEKDVDLLTYYLRSSLEAFVQGDFEKSFMDAFKIALDNKGESFKGIYKLPEDKERYQHYADVRDCLSHAKHTSKNKEQRSKDKELQIKETKKNLYKETLKILKLVKEDFLGAAIAGQLDNSK